MITPRVTISEARRIFEQMHRTRNLTTHHLRGTYIYPAIAALWNQHLKTLRHFDLLDETVKDDYTNSGQ